MSDVEIPFGDKPSETATLLLAAAMEKDGNTSAVRTSEGAFVVPEEIAKAAGFGAEEDEPPKAPAKKTARKATKK